jgi:hypothetical protein
LYGWVRPSSGATYWLLMPRVNVANFERALAEFALANGASEEKVLLVVVDNAGWQRSPKLQVPAGIELIFLPPYSPELQPAERLWSLSDEAVANRHLTSLEELEERQVARCETLRKLPQVVKGGTLFHWWTSAA